MDGPLCLLEISTLIFRVRLWRSNTQRLTRQASFHYSICPRTGKTWKRITKTGRHSSPPATWSRTFSSYSQTPAPLSASPDRNRQEFWTRLGKRSLEGQFLTPLHQSNLKRW